MNDMPMGLAFVLAITAEEEAEQVARERAYDEREAERSKVVRLDSRRPSLPPPTRRAA